MKKTTRPSSKKTSKNLKPRVVQPPVPARRGSPAVRNGASGKNSASSNSKNSNARKAKTSNGAKTIAQNPHGIPDWRDPTNREATIRFSNIAVCDALTYSVQREQHNVALEVVEMIGGTVLRSVDDALVYAGLGQPVLAGAR